MIRKVQRFIAFTAFAFYAISAAVAQNSLPAPGSGGSFNPNPGPSYGGGFNPGPPPPSYWGSPWYNGWGYSPSIVISPSVSNDFQNQGVTKVVACGYDATGVWRVLPLVVSYQYNGIQYDVNVLNAWNPWTDQWDRNIDVQAYNTDYVLRNVTYDFYTILSFGTFYFNL
ncbi:MAG: hypothetical protein NC204_07400 [Candidatus Amulumruptor caecigallinarius]|nr:hypothetical protein [Candidatus Amulumruptor caecigallinarius]